MKQHQAQPSGYIEGRTFIVRGQKVMLDRDLAELYGVETKYLNRQVKRNSERFPAEFMFRLTKSETNELVTNWHRFQSLKHCANWSHLPVVGQFEGKVIARRSLPKQSHCLKGRLLRRFAPRNDIFPK